MPSSVRPPYRAPAPPAEAEALVADTSAPDRELWPVLAAVWAASALQVAGTVAAHQVFGTEATLALAGFLVVPALVLRPLAARLRQWRRQSRS